MTAKLDCVTQSRWGKKKPWKGGTARTQNNQDGEIVSGEYGDDSGEEGTAP